MNRVAATFRRSAIVSTSAFVVLVAATLAPGLVSAGSVVALLRIPLEALAAVAVLAALPWRRFRRILATLASLVVLLAIVSATLDRAFNVEVGRPFNIASDWPDLGDALGVIRDSTGSLVEVLILIALVVLAALILVAVTWSLLRVDRVVRGHMRGALVGGLAAVATWTVLTLLGTEILPGLPLAASDLIAAASGRKGQLVASTQAEAGFRRVAAEDGYASLPASGLLTGLKGKDVIVVFIESYGQVAVQHTTFSAGVDGVLRQGDGELAKDGYSERSAFLTSPTFGGISWLAHSTLQTGLWIDTQQRYDQVTAGDRFTLSDAFRKAGWRTVSDVPSDAAPWPVGKSFYHFGTELDSRNVGYEGPRFSYARIPDQYTFAHFQRAELARPHTPVMAEIDLDSSHTPWTPLPHTVPWAAIGNGSIYDPQPAEGVAPSVAWQSQRQVQTLYGRSVQYSLTSLFSFLTTFDDPNLVLVVLGDHQPAAEVSGVGANHDVPISIISKDPSVIQRISGWNWQPGMLPSPTAPVWRMDAFRNRFLSAYGSPRP